MPSFRLTERETRQTAIYVLSLSRSTARPGPGNAERGAAVYQSNGCASCHVVDGRGGILGPELSTIGGRRGAVYLREAIVKPAACIRRAISSSAPCRPAAPRFAASASTKTSSDPHPRRRRQRALIAEVGARPPRSRARGGADAVLHSRISEQLDDLVVLSGHAARCRIIAEMNQGHKGRRGRDAAAIVALLAASSLARAQQDGQWLMTPAPTAHRSRR